MTRVKRMDINSIYSKMYKKKLKKTFKRNIAAIEIESGDIFIGASVMQATMLAREKYPDKTFYFVRIGYRAAHSIKGVVV